MNTLVRVKRILGPLKRFEYITGDHVPALDISLEALGDVIGRYKNTSSGNGDIWIYANGLAWLVDVDAQLILFNEIEKVVIPNGKKDSVKIDLIKSDGQVLALPVDGNDGLRFDSLEMVRFLDRVLQDKAASSA
jgi:hypothetical protein